jgi:hypothetical protein
MKSKPKTKTCPSRNGGGIVPWGTSVVPCGNCDGKGKV